MERLGCVPVEGDRFEWEEFYFEVQDMDGHPVDEVLLKKEVRE